MMDYSANSAFDGKRLPFSNEAEQSVLGAILIDPSSINLVLDILKPEYFYIPQNKEIFKVLLLMHAKSNTIDFITVLEALKQERVYDEIGGKAYLTKIVESVPTSANIVTYANIVRERYNLRSLIAVSKKTIEDASSGAFESNELLESVAQSIYEIRQGRAQTGLKHIEDVILGETYDRLEKIKNPETKNDYIGIPTGFSALDKVITGLHKSDLIIVGARPGMGKTAFALNIARNVALNTNKTICFFSLEMTRDQLAQRLLSTQAQIESAKFRTGDLTKDEYTRLADAGKKLGETKLYLDETSNMTVPAMKAKLLRMKNVDLVIVDYLGLLQSASKKDNRVQEVSEITRQLKILAKELAIPVIVCAQLNRGPEAKSGSHKPALSELRESGSIEQDADIVLFVYREGYYAEQKKPDPNNPVDVHKAEIIVAKNRHGGQETVPLYWDGQYTRFTSVVQENRYD